MKRKLLILSMIILILVQIGKSQNPHSQLWGMTLSGGRYGFGTIYKMPLNGSVISIVHSFTISTGSRPNGNLIKAPNNKLYGLTSEGGTNNGGVLFSIDLATEEYTRLINFDATTGTGHEFGNKPNGSLLLANDGLLYGTTSSGGDRQAGVLFSFNPTTNKFKKLSDFDPVSGINPITPVGSLLQASDGLLYGLTSNGGVNTNSRGVLFRFNPSTKAMKYWEVGPPPIGRTPRGSLIQKGSYLYGTTFTGGKCDNGTVFRFALTDHTFQNVIEFCENQPAIGLHPFGALLEIPQTSKSNFYGTTPEGGIGGKGNIFTFNDLNFLETYPVSFNGAEKGSNPEGSLIKASNNKLYGTTSKGGTNDRGVVFSYLPSTNTFTKIHDFSSGSDNGSSPTEDVFELICAPSRPGDITGETEVCKRAVVTYSISDVPGATSYKWTVLPIDAHIVGSATGRSINVQFSLNGGEISVQASNGTCLSFSRKITVSTKNCGLF